MTVPDPAASLGRGGRFALRVIIFALRTLQRLPDRPLYQLAHLAGSGLYLVTPGRRAMARANLRHVCAWLVAEGRATPRVAAAAADPKALDRLVRAAFGHWVVGYVEGAIAPRYSREDLLERVGRATPEASDLALRTEHEDGLGPIHMSMHFGSVDISALFGALVPEQPLSGPMEEVADPIARAYFGHVRRELGVTILPLAGAATGLADAVRRGEAVGLVADRIVVGHTVTIRPESGGTRKATLSSILAQEVAAFEQLIARAPEQWSTIMFPIWDDIRQDDR